MENDHRTPDIITPVHIGIAPPISLSGRARSHTVQESINQSKAALFKGRYHMFSRHNMESLVFLILALGHSTFACIQEGQCRELSGCVQVCASEYWQDVDVDGYKCYGGVLLPDTILLDVDSASITVGPPVQATTQPGTYSASATVESPSQVSQQSRIDIAPVIAGPSSQVISSISADSAPTTWVPHQNSVPKKEDVGHWYCSGKQPPVRDEEAFTASYTPGGSMASVYYPEQPLFRCNIQPPASNYYVAVWTRHDPDHESQPQPRNCNEWLTLENPKNGLTATALVIDRCASCVGVGHQTSDNTTSDIWVNGATIDLSPDLFKYLYSEAPDGVFDIKYNGSIYGGSWDGDPDVLKDPKCKA
jgi:hypothetical protein